MILDLERSSALADYDTQTERAEPIGRRWAHAVEALVVAWHRLGDIAVLAVDAAHAVELRLVAHQTDVAAPSGL